MMKFFYQSSVFLSILLILVFGSVNVESRWKDYYTSSNKVDVHTIYVDQRGYGNFKTIQAAIDSIPLNNNQWIRIHVKEGIYREKVIIPRDKPFIVLQGEGRARTIIEWNDHSTLADSPTFSLLADNFVAQYISFKNGYNYEVRRTESNSDQNLKPAVAAFIQGNKASFYYCGFYGIQDTLWDAAGLHYFKDCFIEGAIDFIFGMGQSIYEKCAISVIEGMLYPEGVQGYITAQGRDNADATNGFVFKNCNVFGNGKAYLGRAWREYSRVIFYKSGLSNVIVPEGWNAWNYYGKEDKITYAERGCTGMGSDTSKRVKWANKLSANMVAKFADISFIDQDGWLKQQPY